MRVKNECLGGGGVMNDKMLCVKCKRLARWLWLGSNYDEPAFVCGYHKRAYGGVVLWGNPDD